MCVERYSSLVNTSGKFFAALLFESLLTEMMITAAYYYFLFAFSSNIGIYWKWSLEDIMNGRELQRVTAYQTATHARQKLTYKPTDSLPQQILCSNRSFGAKQNVYFLKTAVVLN